MRYGRMVDTMIAARGATGGKSVGAVVPSIIQRRNGHRGGLSAWNAVTLIVFIACFIALGEAGAVLSSQLGGIRCLDRAGAGGAAASLEEGMATMDAENDVVERVDLRLRVEDLELMEVLCARAEPQNAGHLVKLLGQHLSLPELKYLKRVRRLEAADGTKGAGDVLVLLGPLEEANAVADWVMDKIRSLSHEIRAEKVPAYPPNTREQFDRWCSVWPLNFRPPAGGLKALSAFSDSELASMKGHMASCISLAKSAYSEGYSAVGAVIVDPATGHAVAQAHDKSSCSAPFCAPALENKIPCPTDAHPLAHAAMQAVQAVAAKHRQRDGINLGEAGDAVVDGGGDKDVSGGGGDKKRALGDAPREDVQDMRYPRQYLCTGYDVYLTHEPCPMCAMALVHSRVRRVFFSVSRDDYGALGGRWAVHQQKSLNHHYEVYKGLLRRQCEHEIACLAT